MVQETRASGPTNSVPWDFAGQGLVALLALVGSRSMNVEAFRTRTKLTPAAFRSLLGWLQREYLVDVVSNLSGRLIEEKVELTEKGEAVLLGMLEKACELPELR